MTPRKDRHRQIQFPDIGELISKEMQQRDLDDDDLFRSVGLSLGLLTKSNFERYLGRLRQGYIYGLTMDRGINYHKKLRRLSLFLYCLRIESDHQLIQTLRGMEIEFGYPPPYLQNRVPGPKKKGLEITLCGSPDFYDDMVDLGTELFHLQHTVHLPEQIPGTNYGNKPAEVGIQNIQEHDLIRKHYRRIQKSDALLVVNKSKRGIGNYIGGDAFLEMGFAYVLDKRIYVLNPLPREVSYYEEMTGMNPIILNGDLLKI